MAIATKKIQTRCISIDGQSIGVRTLDEARLAWLDYRDTSGLGASDVAPGTGDYFENGVRVARVSYNGRLWAMDGSEISLRMEAR